MFLEISNTNTGKYFLSFYEKDKLVGYRTFNFKYKNKLDFDPPLVGPPDIYEVTDNLLIVKPNQSYVDTTLEFNVQSPEGKIIRKSGVTLRHLGFRVNLFEGEIKQCFEVFKFSLYDWETYDQVNLPVIINPADIQLIWNNALVKDFGIPSPVTYIKICEYYGVEPSQEITSFLIDLFNIFLSN